MITGLDHIAIAVPDLDKAIERFAEDFGLTLKGREDVEEAKTSAAFLPMADEALYEVTLSNTGLLARPLNDGAKKALEHWQ